MTSRDWVIEVLYFDHQAAKKREWLLILGAQPVKSAIGNR